MGLFSVFTNQSGVIENQKILEEFKQILLESEQIEVGFKLQKDTFIFTDKRLILVNQNEESKQISYVSIPYTSISTFVVETEKSFHHKAKLKIWAHAQPLPTLEKEFNKSVDVYVVQKILARHVLK